MAARGAPHSDPLPKGGGGQDSWIAAFPASCGFSAFMGITNEMQQILKSESAYFSCSISIGRSRGVRISDSASVLSLAKTILIL